MSTVLHVAPHPDDESLGAPCTLLGLAERGARVVVAACGLGRPDEHARRRAELEAATSAAGFELVVRHPPAAFSTAEPGALCRELVPWVGELIDRHDAALVVGPHYYDARPAHELVAQVVAEAVRTAARPPVWWAWGIWADLRAPTLLVPCPERLVERALAVLAHYEGENARNDFPTMLRAAGRLNAVRGVERVLGFGAAALPGVHHAELLTELGRHGDGWRRGTPRVDPEPWLPASWSTVVAPSIEQAFS